jgi:Rrf2 family protein
MYLAGAAMKITSRVCYGLKILNVLADAYGAAETSYVSSSVIAAKEDIPKRYADQLLSLLTLSGIVDARHGAAGGYALTRPPADISIKEIFEAMEGAVLSARCLDKKRACPDEGDCSGHKIWKKLESEIVKTLAKTSLADLNK